jgi:hypothetical protein
MLAFVLRACEAVHHLMVAQIIHFDARWMVWAVIAVVDQMLNEGLRLRLVELEVNVVVRGVHCDEGQVDLGLLS